jgi:16S rRNA (adenine1518-N6/adenine1519-N6)-dimethyltransferase
MKPKKSLGQNFLTSESALTKIIESAELSEGDTVLEIGPGKGALTLKLLQSGAKVFAIEKDKELVNFLKEKFEKYLKTGDLIIQEWDILNFDPEADKIIKNKYKIIANIPYYITGQIIRKFLTTKNTPSKMVLLVQKEVAERIIAKDGKESMLSLSVKLYGDPKYMAKVSRGSFFPIPSVDSAIIQINNIKQPYGEAREKRFFEILHAGFGQKRKMILGNLKEIFGNKESAEKILKECKIDPKKRAEDIDLPGWKCLADINETKLMY